MTEFLTYFHDLLGPEKFIPLLRALVILAVGFFIFRITKKSILKLTSSHLNHNK